jgi:hypothetical protein
MFGLTKSTKMAMFGAIAIAAGALEPIRARRAPNRNRISCESAVEDEYKALRLRQHEVQALAYEYAAWREQTEGVRMRVYYSLKRMKIFLLYLARGGYYHQLGRAEGISECTTMQYLHSVSEFFQETAYRLVYCLII